MTATATATATVTRFEVRYQTRQDWLAGVCSRHPWTYATEAEAQAKAAQIPAAMRPHVFPVQVALLELKG